MSIEGVLVSSTALQSSEFVEGGGGGGLNCEAKAQVLVVTPRPLFFLKVGRKRGGRNSGAVRYMLYANLEFGQFLGLFAQTSDSTFNCTYNPRIARTMPGLSNELQS